MAKETGIDQSLIALYDSIVAKIPEMERKGKGTPYTSMNGNMYTMMRKDGALGIRLSKEEQEIFMEKHNAVPFENYGSMIKDYVEVPYEVFMNEALMLEYMKKSHEYSKTLKPKATKKKAANKKKTPDKETKKVTHEVGSTYKNGQVKSEIVESQLINYYEDGSIKAKGLVVNEQMEGRWIFNRKGGQLWQIGHFNADVKNGEWIRYDSKDQVAYHVIFENGKVTKKIE